MRAVVGGDGRAGELRGCGGRCARVFLVGMQLGDYLPILVQAVVAVGLAVGIIVASHLFGQRSRRNATKDSAYECGMRPDGKPSAPFSVKFYVVAMLFILFDIEVIFLLPWAVIYRDFLAAGVPVLAPMLFFLGVLVLGLVYEYRKKALDWER